MKREGATRTITDARIGTAMRLAETRSDALVTTDALAKAVGLSKFHFVRLFHDQAGETVGDYIRRVRLDDAAMRLRWSSESIVSIAMSVGYGSQAAFTRAFSTRFGRSPASYRRSSEPWTSYPEDERTVRAVTVRRFEVFACLAHRYFGPYERAPERWRHFVGHLPVAVTASPDTRYINLSYDDPRITPPDQIRHDCCVVVSGRADGLAGAGLQAMRTTPGLYAGSLHRGSDATVPATYGLILDRWLPAQSRYQVRGDVGVMEIYASGASLPLSQTCACEVMMPVYSGGPPQPA